MWMYGGRVSHLCVASLTGNSFRVGRLLNVVRRPPTLQLCAVAPSRQLHESQLNYEDKKEQHGMLVDMEKSLLKRLEHAGFKRSRRFYGVVTSIFLAMVVGAGYLYLFPHKLRQQVVEEVSTVASKSLEDEKILNRAEQLSKDVVNGILNDDETKAVASGFVKDIIVSQPIKDSAVGTILGLLNDEQVLNLLRQRLSEIILDILQREDTRQIVMSQITSILVHDSVREALQDLLQDLLNTPEVETLMADFFKDVLAADSVRDQGKVLGQQIATDVITSKEIQEQAGTALWSAVKFSVTPNALRGKKETPSEAEKLKEDVAPTNSKDESTKSQRDRSKTVLTEDNFLPYYDDGYDTDEDNLKS